MSSFRTQQEYMRDDHRGQVLLKAHLEAGQWKSEAWALADSLAWALKVVTRPPTGEGLGDLDAAEYRLAQDRLARVRKAIHERAAA